LYIKNDFYTLITLTPPSFSKTEASH